ncbi:unnamed protein product [Prunus armeniaca]
MKNWSTTCAVKSGRQPRTGKLANHLCHQIGQVAGEIIVGHQCTEYRWLEKSWSDTYVLGTGTREYQKATWNGETGQPLVELGTGKLAKHLCIQIGQVAGKIIVGHLCTKYRYTQISKGNWEQGNRATTYAFKSGWWLGKSLLDTCVLSIGTCKYPKATGNKEIGQPLVQSYRASGFGNRCRTTNYVLSTGQLGTGKLANHLCNQIGQVAGEIIIGHQCTKYRYTQISKGNWEQGNWPTTYAFKSCRWLEKSWSDTCVLGTGTREYQKATWNGETGKPHVQSNRAVTRKYPKAIGNRETGQPPVHSNRQAAGETIVDGESIVEHQCTKYRYTQISKGNWEQGNWRTTCAFISGRWLGKSWSDTCVLSTSTREYQKATRNREIGQLHVQSNRAGNREQGNWPTTGAVKSGRWLGKSLSDTCVLSTGTRKYLKATGNRQPRTGKLVNHLCNQIEQVAQEIIVGHQFTKQRYTKIFKGNWERGNGPTNGAVNSGRQLRKSLSDNSVLSIGIRKYLKTTGNRKTGQPPVPSNQVAGEITVGLLGTKYRYMQRQLGTGKLANHLCCQIGQVVGEIIVAHLCTKYNYTQICKGIQEQGNWPTTRANKLSKWLGKSLLDNYPRSKHRYTKIFKGNWEQGNWLTTCAVKLSRWLGKSLSETCVLTTGTHKYVKATGNRETGQPLVQSNQASGWENHCCTTNYDLSNGTRKYLKATKNEETCQPPVQSNRAGQPGTGKLANHLCRQIGQVAGEIIVGHLFTKYRYTQIDLKATGNRETGQPPVQSNRASGWGNHFRTTNYDLSIGTRKYLKATKNGETCQPSVQSNRAGNRERGNWPTTCADKSGRYTQIDLKATGNRETGQPPVQSNRASGWGNHFRTTNYDLSIGTRKYLKATKNGETCQPPVQSNRAGGCGNHCRTPVYTQIDLKAIGNRETGQPPVQSNRASGWGNHCWATNYDLSIGTRKYLKPTGNEETGPPPVQ